MEVIGSERTQLVRCLYFTLIEVLMALTIFAVAIGGLSISFHRILNTSLSLKSTIHSSNTALSEIDFAEESLALGNLGAVDATGYGNGLILELPSSPITLKHITLSIPIPAEARATGTDDE